MRLAQVTRDAGIPRAPETGDLIHNHPTLYRMGLFPRRHLSTGQQAMSTALVLADAGKRKNGRWQRGALPIADTGKSSDSDWHRALSKAGHVIDYAPELADAVVAGRLALDAAYKQAETARENERAEEAERQRQARGCRCPYTLLVAPCSRSSGLSDGSASRGTIGQP